MRNASLEMIPLPRIGPGSAFGPLRVARGERVFVLTGAGISAESGVRTFRDAGAVTSRTDGVQLRRAPGHRSNLVQLDPVVYMSTPAAEYPTRLAARDLGLNSVRRSADGGGRSP